MSYLTLNWKALVAALCIFSLFTSCRFLTDYDDDDDYPFIITEDDEEVRL